MEAADIDAGTGYAGSSAGARVNSGAVEGEGRCIIETKGLSKSYPGRRDWRLRRAPDKVAVEDVSIRLTEGEILGLVGPNGAGKTTLVRMLSTLVAPTSGSASVAGHDVLKEEGIVRRMVGLVSSNERSFYWRLTGRENLEFFAALYRLSKRDALHWTGELMELLSIDRIADQRFDEYSTGQKQRMAIARGLLNKPKILLMDEPTKGVDPVGAAELVTSIREGIINLWHPTILITSHNLTEIERLCGRVALMRAGRLVALGGVEELKRRTMTTNRYRLQITDLGPDRLDELCRASDPVEPAVITMRGNIADIEVCYARDAGGFPGLVRGIVESGGDLRNCTAVDSSFDDVFHALLSDQEEKKEAMST